MKDLFCLAALLATASLSACAQAPQPSQATTPTADAASSAPKADTADGRAREALQTLNPQIRIDYVGAGPLPGFREVIVGGQVVLVSDDGKYLVQGTVLDIAQKKELTQSSPALSKYRQGLLKSIKASDRIAFAPSGKTDYTVSVFTDIECGYCRKLHSEIAEYNKRGIAIEYMAFPRMGLGSKDHLDMISVWCASDRKQALTDAKNGKPVPAKSCKSTPVDMEYNVGQRLGINGTPAIFAPDGSQLGGYLPPQQMREALDKLAGQPAGMQ